jgi:hypothetical protein
LTTKLPIPPRDVLINHVLSSLGNYWTQNFDQLLSLPIDNVQQDLKISIPLKLEAISLPDWANDCGVNGQLLVPRECIDFGSEVVDWKKVDWWTAIFLLMEGWHERIWEATNGVIHSYSYKLKGWDTRAWDHAWVNRIAIFLRKWFQKETNNCEILLGVLPEAKFTLSHDVDAVSKTLPIRLKQGAFNLFNSLSYLRKGNFKKSILKFGDSFRMLFGNEDWWVFDKLIEMEDKAAIKAVYHFYGDDRPKSLQRWLMDPSYDTSDPRLKKLFEKLKKEGHEIGLHPTFDCWNDSVLLRRQKQLLEKNAGVEIKKCRQHWLRFSWQDTWRAQTKASIQVDSTLMFNDRSGFRNSTAISWSPWNLVEHKQHELKCTTSVLMDSHLYDYQNFRFSERIDQIKSWTNECKSVYGECSLLWHPHTLTNDYGWELGLKQLLETSL